MVLWDVGFGSTRDVDITMNPIGKETVVLHCLNICLSIVSVFVCVGGIVDHCGYLDGLRSPVVTWPNGFHLIIVLSTLFWILDCDMGHFGSDYHVLVPAHRIQLIAVPFM